jgi:hypothetical protein
MPHLATFLFLSLGWDTTALNLHTHNHVVRNLKGLPLSSHATCALRTGYVRLRPVTRRTVRSDPADYNYLPKAELKWAVRTRRVVIVLNPILPDRNQFIGGS